MHNLAYACAPFGIRPTATALIAHLPFHLPIIGAFDSIIVYYMSVKLKYSLFRFYTL